MNSITNRERSIIRSLIRFGISQSPSRRKHFACAVDGKTVVFAQNQYKEIRDRAISEFYKYPSPHAEFELIRRFGSFKKVFVVRLNQRGFLINSEPCKRCKQFLFSCGVKFVIFSSASGEIKKIKLR